MRNTIEQWMLAAIGKEPTEFFDLHIDDIDERFTERSEWLSGSAECLRVAAEIRDRIAPGFDVAVAFGLAGETQPRGLDVGTWDDVSRMLEWSPPSLYVARGTNAPWAIGSECREVSGLAELPGLSLRRVHLCEWFDENDHEYRRSLWLVL